MPEKPGGFFCVGDRNRSAAIRRMTPVEDAPPTVFITVHSVPEKPGQSIEMSASEFILLMEQLVNRHGATNGTKI